VELGCRARGVRCRSIGSISSGKTEAGGGVVEGDGGLWKIGGVDNDGGSPGDNAAVVERRACGAGGEDPTDRKPLLLSVFMGPIDVGASVAVVVTMSGFIGGRVGAGDRIKGAVGAAEDASTGEGTISSDIARHAICKIPASNKTQSPLPIKGSSTSSARRLAEQGDPQLQGRPGDGIHGSKELGCEMAMTPE